MQQNQLASVNYRRLAQLKKHTGADNNLWLVYEALVFSWQNSKIVQKGKKLCCPTISRIAELANVSERTAYRKIKSLELMGLITSFTKRLRNGTVRSFFSICIDKIEQVIATAKKEPEIVTQANENAGTAKMSDRELPNCQPHIYKEKIEKEENNNNKAMSTTERNRVEDDQQSVSVNSLAIAQVDVLAADPQSDINTNLEDKIGDSLTTRQGCRVNGAINNLIRKEGIHISDPKGLKAQVAFKILLKSDKSGRDNFQHQLNAAMKLIREGKWSTPHGYYNHSDEGRVVKAQILEREKQWQEQKRIEMMLSSSDVIKDNDTPAVNIRLGQGGYDDHGGSARVSELKVSDNNHRQVLLSDGCAGQKCVKNFTNPFKNGGASRAVMQQLTSLRSSVRKIAGRAKSDNLISS